MGEKISMRGIHCQPEGPHPLHLFGLPLICGKDSTAFRMDISVDLLNLLCFHVCKVTNAVLTTGAACRGTQVYLQPRSLLQKGIRPKSDVPSGLQRFDFLKAT